MTRLLAAGFIAALMMAGVAIAASSTGWTPKQVQAELTSQSVTIQGATLAGPITLDGSPFRGRGVMQSATCKGLGKEASGGYQVFTCSLVWQSSFSTTPTQLTAWVRPYSGSTVCVTAISIGACPPPPPVHPLSGDPRACGIYSYVHCIVGAAETAAVNALRAKNLIGVNYGCQAITAFIYRCAGLGAGANPATVITVKFVPGKTAWSTTVAFS